MWCILQNFFVTLTVASCKRLLRTEHETMAEVIKTNIRNVGPVLANTLATGRLRKYKTGIYEASCYVSPTDVIYVIYIQENNLNQTTNHVVNLISWGKMAGPSNLEYWIATNVWGKTWGSERGRLSQQISVMCRLKRAQAH